MAYKVIILYRLYMPPYFLGTFTEYPYNKSNTYKSITYGAVLLSSLLQPAVKPLPRREFR